MTNPLFDLTGEVAVITGAGRGIGEGMAKTLADAGCHVVCAARSVDQIQSVADEINASNSGGRAIAQATDVTSREDMEALAQRAVDEFGRLDIWVNNAGGSLISAPLTELDEAEWDKTMAVNLTSVFHGVRAACKHFGEGSRIVNTSSMAGQDPFPGSGHYSAAKAGVLMLTKTLAHELGPKTRVNAILPGFVPTETVKEALSMKDEDFIGFEDTLGLPAGRLGTPQDIGALTLYLCAPASEWVTGQCIRIAGTP
ncbi:NAD(P)-dependent dehydrogenase, short-chain alcohol dehydrogenase family [Parasphingorhabdus marina DSM 22363]|uniref:NAD(P)-dependent dehydrogenase, short-chain alcohol dehydrogenase family n=1 Tax=Parasphingorhabdus marina DSM 22363 TaxID=1123272 RepID=A0A1N6CN80_9SPHN|nr:SDR family oxidoreductase [Parasphingorhabdus marina]SIN59895.1 NAD(P)-dependent dehydrogenase, short-chain alcohol dehydrogenase family [Parasphingorhabdus marina DSM 22363]